MKNIANYLTIVCFVIGASFGWALFAQGEEHPPEQPAAGQEWHDPVSGIDVVWVPKGCFQMGCVSGIDCEDDEKPVHKVCLDGFWMGKTEVTQGQWKNIMGSLTDPSLYISDAHPAIYTSWKDVQEFLNELNRKAGKAIYRMPTEAEWEYAARAGTETAYSFGNDAGKLSEYAWVVKKDVAPHTGPHPVGQFRPNAWGLYDMHGNVWEWCQDWYEKSYYAHSPSDNPQGPETGSFRVYRGAGCAFTDETCRAADRDSHSPSYRNIVGFRLVRTPL